MRNNPSPSLCTVVLHKKLCPPSSWIIQLERPSSHRPNWEDPRITRLGPDPDDEWTSTPLGGETRPFPSESEATGVINVTQCSDDKVSAGHPLIDVT